MTGNDVTWPLVPGSDPGVRPFDRKSLGSGCGRPKTGLYCTFHFLQGCSSQEAVTWLEMTSLDIRSPKVSPKLRHLSKSHLEVAVEGRKLAYTVHFTCYKAVARRRRQSPDRKWRHVTLDERKWPWSSVIWREVPWKCVEKAENTRIRYISLPTRL